jgi:rubrerythrin
MTYGAHMAEPTVYKQGWTLDEVQWDAFDASKASPRMVAAIKAAALVELNAPDYVAYLKRVFKDAPQMHATIEEWGREESQHGRALGRWAELADPTYKMADAFARFRAGYRPPHFHDETADASIRGSRRGEMIARCVVESGTSSYYTAIRDATDEPVLKEIAGRIAADEFRHYKLFFETLQMQDEPDLPFWRKLMVAVGRISESDDDELAFAYYCANVPASEVARTPYHRAHYAKLAAGLLNKIYRRQHIQKLVQMVAKAIGVQPQGRPVRLASAALWLMLRIRGGGSDVPAAA